MNKISTEHVTKNSKSSISYTPIIVSVIALISISILVSQKDAFTCNSQKLVSVWKPRQVLDTDGYALRAVERPNIYEDSQDSRAVLASIAKPEIEVGGIRETDEALTFAMSDFSEEMTYMIDFGNGTTRPLEDKSIAHVYQESGTYKVTVKGIHQGETKVISTKFLMVADAIETPAFIAEVEI